jgi:hypothetical protein
LLAQARDLLRWRHGCDNNLARGHHHPKQAAFARFSPRRHEKHKGSPRTLADRACS